MDQQEALAINPIVADSVGHNSRTLTNVRSLTSSLSGICAGALGLESYAGFAFYIFSSLFVSFLIYIGPAKRQPERYFYSVFSDLWIGNILGDVMGFILTWTLLYNLVGA